MGPGKEASRLSTGSWHSSDCLSMLTVLMPSKRQNRHQKTRHWECQPSQCQSKWNEGAMSQNKPFPPYVALGGILSQQWEWSYPKIQGRGIQSPTRWHARGCSGNHGALFTFCWGACRNIRKSWLLQYRQKDKWILQREVRVAARSTPRGWLWEAVGTESRKQTACCQV